LKETLKFNFAFLFFVGMQFRLNKKGFNLFTALISFLLIMLAVLLVHSMIQTQSNALRTIDQIESRSRLEATAEMARADAMQVFNYALRKKIEDWLVDEQTGVVQLDLQHKSWEDIQKEFAESKFSSTKDSQFAFYAARSLEAFFYNPVHFGNYKVEIENAETLEKSIKNAIDASTDDFFTVVECPDGDPRTCEKGTFYVNLHLERLTQEQYEDFPLIKVTDKATGEEIKEIILPKTTFRIFVPIRFFKAIAEARALTHFPRAIAGFPAGSGYNYKDTRWMDTANDAGLFSPMNHNEIEQMALGMCDYGKCAPRTNPLEKAEEDSLTKTGEFCPGDNDAPDWRNPLTIRLEYPSDAEWAKDESLPKTYNANNYDNDWTAMSNALSDIGDAKVCSVLRDAEEAGFIDSDKEDLFVLVGNKCSQGTKMLAYEITVNPDARDSKALGIAGGEAGSDPGRNLGLFTSSGGIVDFPRLGIAQLPCADWDSSLLKSRCSEVKSVEVVLAFKEENPDYMVRQPKEGEERLYRIAVYDNTFVPFTANWNQGGMDSDYLYSKAPETTNCSFSSGWACVSIAAPTMSGRSYNAGCKPPSS